MREHKLDGSAASALSHLMLVGLAAVIEESGEHEAVFAWSSETMPVPVLWTELAADQIAAIVRAHAMRHTKSASWVQAEAAGGELRGRRLFAPRAAAPKAPAVSSAESMATWKEGWGCLARERHDLLDQAGDVVTLLDLRMLAGIGEPAWWRCTGKDNQPDMGASRWEMKTRNRGEDFVKHRLGPLAESVAARSETEVWSGLSGQRLMDEVGGAPDSRTPTGLTLPRPTDNAQAWCALWGISALPTIHTATTRVAHGHSQSPGTFPRNRVHPERAALPVFTSATTVSHYRAICVSEAFDRLVAESPPNLSGSGPSAARMAAAAWLKEQGVRAVMQFGVQKVGSASAPERQLLAGRAEVL